MSNLSLKKEGCHRDNLGRFKKGTHWRPHSIFREKEYLQDEYLVKQRSAGDIAREHRVTDTTIYFWLGKHGIKTRTISETRAVKFWGCKGSDNPMFGKYGNKNPRFIDGSSPERQSFYSRFFWKELSKEVFKRDDYKCQRCGSDHICGIPLHAHHIKPWAGNPDSRFDITNIITICKTCHSWIHSKANLKNEFLST